MNKLVSIVLPAFNCSNSIGNVIQSLISQTYRNIEIIVIDDGSSDDTITVVKSFVDSRIVLFELVKNSGISHALNKGLELARGNYIARVDSDDFCERNRIEIQVDFLEKNSNIDLCGTFQRIVGGYRDGLNQTAITSREIKSALVFGPTMLHSTVMFRKSVVNKFGTNLYNPDYYLCEDYELWSRLSKKIRFENIPQYLCHYDWSGPKNWESNSTSLIISLRKIYYRELRNLCFFSPPDVMLNYHLILVGRSNLHNCSVFKVISLTLYSAFIAFCFLFSPGYSSTYGIRKICMSLLEIFRRYISNSSIYKLYKKRK